jgi:anaerobic magnesium-protoporphyrin IX monomethyl ester cyclase
MSNLSPMKILLIYPYFLNTRQHNPADVRAVPLGVYYVAGVLRQHNYDVEILNWHNINTTPHTIPQVLTDKRPDVIGFSILNANRWGGIDIARIAKQADPRVKVVFGGIGATFLWQHFLTHFPEIDYVVIGEGEYPFLKLVRSIEAGQPHAIESIQGLAFRKEGQVLRTPDADPIHQLDDLPDPSKYFEFQHLALTRGCGGNCNFCGSPRFWGRRVRFHSADFFVEQIERLFTKGIRFFYFSDDTFTFNKKRVIEICRKIIEKKLDVTWNAISRVDHVTEEILYWMRKAGCIQISYGVESGSEKIRKFLLKNISIEKIQSAFAITQKYGIMARAYFIYGNPGENRHTIQETIDLINAIKPLSAIFYILDIFPGTTLYEDFKQRLNASDDIWLNRIEDIMYFETDPDLTREMILGFGQKLRSSFFENLPGFVEAIELIDNVDLYPQHARFLFRLGMTFDHGDYAAIDAIPDKDRLVERLYQKSLTYFPDAEAYLGLGIRYQKRDAQQDAIDILSKGLSHFPGDPRLNICMGVGLMNQTKYDQALDRFLKFQDEKDAVQFAARCYEALGEAENAAALLEKYNQIKNL